MKFKIKGSLVVEAAFIFPLLIIAIFAVILFAYYERDITVLRSEVRCELIKNVSEGITEGIKETFENDRKGHLFYLSYNNMEEIYGKDEGKVSTEVNFKIFPFVSMYLDKDLTDGRFEETYKDHTPQRFARKIGAIDDFFQSAESKEE